MLLANQKMHKLQNMKLTEKNDHKDYFEDGILELIFITCMIVMK